MKNVLSANTLVCALQLVEDSNTINLPHTSLHQVLNTKLIHGKAMCIGGVVVKCTYSAEMEVTGSSPLQFRSFLLNFRQRHIRK